MKKKRAIVGMVVAGLIITSLVVYRRNRCPLGQGISIVTETESQPAPRSATAEGKPFDPVSRWKRIRALGLLVWIDSGSKKRPVYVQKDPPAIRTGIFSDRLDDIRIERFDVPSGSIHDVLPLLKERGGGIPDGQDCGFEEIETVTQPEKNRFKLVPIGKTKGQQDAWLASNPNEPSWEFPTCGPYNIEINHYFFEIQKVAPHVIIYVNGGQYFAPFHEDLIKVEN